MSLWFLWMVWEVFGVLLGGGFFEGGGEGEGEDWCRGLLGGRFHKKKFV